MVNFLSFFVQLVCKTSVRFHCVVSLADVLFLYTQNTKEKKKSDVMFCSLFFYDATDNSCQGTWIAQLKCNSRQLRVKESILQQLQGNRLRKDDAIPNKRQLQKRPTAVMSHFFSNCAIFSDRHEFFLSSLCCTPNNIQALAHTPNTGAGDHKAGTVRFFLLFYTFCISFFPKTLHPVPDLRWH